MQLPMFSPAAEWRPPRMENLPSWAEARRIAIDVETCDPLLKQLGIGVRRGGYVTGFSIAIEDGPRHYLPIRHEGGDNLDEAAVLRYLRDNGASFRGDLCGANLSYDLDYLWEEQILFPQVRYYRDVQIADPLIYELHNSYSLDNIANRWGLPGKDETLLREAAAVYKLDPKKDMWRLPARYVGAYAEQDANLPLMLLRRQEREIEEQELWEVYDLESRVLPALVRMRRRGVRIHEGRLDRIEEWALAQETAALEEVHRLTGHRIAVGDVWQADALAPALEAIGLHLGKTSTGKPNIDKAILAGVGHPVGEHLARARKTNKLRTTFAASVRRYMTNGRVHCTYNQIAREDDKGDQKGARYGRLSSTDPNLQQQPSRDEFAKMWRAIYIPDEGCLWAACDYSQQEPRWTTHFAAVMNLQGARVAAQAYHDNPLLDNHQFMADLTGLQRKYAKDLYLGLCYGEGGAKLCRDLELPTRWALTTGRGRDRRVRFFRTREEGLAVRKELQDGYLYETAGEEGQRVMDQFDSRAPFIRKLAREAEQAARKRGYIQTISGRRLHFPQREDGSYDWVHKALNRLIQGTSADQTKRAIVALDEEGQNIQLQVHDEIDGSVPDEATASHWSDVMRTVVEARVPFRVDVEIGESWGHSMGYEGE